MARRRKKDFIGGLIDDTLGGVVGAFASGFRGKKQSRKQPKSNYSSNSGSHVRESRRSSSGRNWDDGPSYRSYGYTASTSATSSPPSRGANWPLRFFVALGIALAAVLAGVGTGMFETNSTSKMQSTPQEVQPSSKPVQTPYKPPTDPTELLAGAVAEDRDWEVKDLIAKHADPNGVYGGLPFLIMAARSHSLKMVGALLDGGANPNVSDGRGWTALMYAQDLMRVADANNYPSDTKQSIIDV